MRKIFTNDAAISDAEHAAGAAEVRVTASVGDAHPDARVSLLAGARDAAARDEEAREDAWRVDAVAGSEFVDDLIRLRE